MDDGAAEIARLAVADPFVWSHVDVTAAVCAHCWMLDGSFPLSSFQPDAFARVRGYELPSSFPLPLIVAQILGDEGLADGDLFEGLPAAIHRRRRALRDGGARVVGTLFDPGLDGYREIPPDSCSFAFGLGVPDIVDWDDEGPFGSRPAALEVGEELLHLIDSRDAARLREEREEWQTAIDGYLRRIGAIRRRGGQAALVHGTTLRALFCELRELVQITRKVATAVPSARTRDLLRAHGVKEPEMRRLAMRLAFPVFSALEIEAIDASRKLRGWTARRVAIRLVARRLALDVPGVARRLGLNAQAEELAAMGKDPFSA